MQLIPLLKLRLKDPRVIEYLRVFDLTVTYDFDRLMENQPDRYWAESAGGELDFVFDEQQILTTIFVRAHAFTGPHAHEFNSIDVDRFDDFGDAKYFAEQNRLAHVTNEGKSNVPEYVRFDRSEYSVHYQFSESGLSMITLMTPSVVPGRS